MARGESTNRALQKRALAALAERSHKIPIIREHSKSDSTGFITHAKAPGPILSFAAARRTENRLRGGNRAYKNIRWVQAGA